MCALRSFLHWAWSFTKKNGLGGWKRCATRGQRKVVENHRCGSVTMLSGRSMCHYTVSLLWCFYFIIEAIIGASSRPFLHGPMPFFCYSLQGVTVNSCDCWRIALFWPRLNTIYCLCVYATHVKWLAEAITQHYEISRVSSRNIIFRRFYLERKKKKKKKKN